MVLKLLVLMSVVAQQTDARSPFTGDGVFGGSSVCNSGLRIYPRTIDWDTRDSDCKHSAYTTLANGPKEFVYQLHPPSHRCSFQILVVSYNALREGWEATGYTTKAAWLRKDKNEELPCGPLY